MGSRQLRLSGWGTELETECMSYATASRPDTNAEANKLQAGDEAVHAWYRFVLSFPPHLVRHYIDRFGVGAGQCVLDPFCGTGTTLVTCKGLGVRSVGVEGTPMGAFATRAKTDWAVDPERLIAHATTMAELASARIDASVGGPLRVLPTEATSVLLRGSISPVPLHKALVLRDVLEEHRADGYLRHEALALAKVLPTVVGNLRFGPEVGVASQKDDAPVVAAWLAEMRSVSEDLSLVRGTAQPEATVHEADSRSLGGLLEPASLDAVITSPPYPNEKDYTRIMRLEMVMLGFVHDAKGLQRIKRGLLCSNTRNVYASNRDDEMVSGHAEIQRVANEIEARRMEMGKTSGFERLYGRVVRLYFGGMLRHLAGLRHALRPGASLAYVVGDQASYLRVMIRTGQLLAGIAEGLGYEVCGTDLFRTRLATATKEQLREEVVVLRWPG